MGVDSGGGGGSHANLSISPQIMFSRAPARGGSAQPSSGSRRQEREIRKLRGELQHETQKFQNMVKKYQKELEDVSSVSCVHTSLTIPVDTMKGFL